MISILSSSTIDILTKDAFGDSMQDQKKGQPYILDLITLKRIFFQSIPLELDYNPDTQLATIAQMGRNTPSYHYSGSEDTLKFTISWFANKEDQSDVLKKVKWLETLTKNDGDIQGIHPVQFVMGELYKDAKWVVAGAPTKLRFFHREFNMYPRLAITEITLKRLADKNLTHAEILKLTT